MPFDKINNTMQRRGALPDAGHAQRNAQNAATLTAAAQEITIERLAAIVNDQLAEEAKVTELLKRALGDKYSDRLDTVVLPGSDHAARKIGRYTIMVSPHIDGPTVLCARDLFHGLRH